MSETRHRTAKGLVASRTIVRNPGPRVPEQLAAAEAEKEAKAKDKKAAARSKKDK